MNGTATSGSAKTPGESLAPRDRGHPAALQLLIAEPQEQRRALPVGNPVRTDRSTRRQQLFDHHVAFELAALVSAIFLRPGHAEQACFPELAAEIGIGLGPAVGAADGIALAMLGHQRAHLLA